MLTALGSHRGRPVTFLGGSVRHNGARWARVLPSGRILSDSELLHPRELDPASLPARPLFVLDPEDLLLTQAPSWARLTSAQLEPLAQAAAAAGPSTVQRLVASVHASRPDLSSELVALLAKQA